MANTMVLTDFTSVVHTEEYPAISPSRPELSQAGRTVLITGGSDGIGFAIAKGFVTASAATVIVLGRSQDKLTKAKKELEEQVKSQGTKTRVIAESCDVTDRKAVDALWAGFQDSGITVDVLVLNSAKFANPLPLLELEEGDLWSQFEGNVRAPYDFAQSFYKQPGDVPRSLLYVSTMGINLFYDWQFPLASERPSYSMTKNFGTMLMQMIAKDVDPAKLQVISFHPGNIFTSAFADLSVSESDLAGLSFEKPSLPGAFAVWAASKEARFLHGRFVWAPWDVEELQSEKFRKHLEEDPLYLRIGVNGLNGGLKAKTYKSPV